jgi:uncharacterized protein (DUF2141 family)
MLAWDSIPDANKPNGSGARGIAREIEKMDTLFRHRSLGRVANSAAVPGQSHRAGELIGLFLLAAFLTAFQPGLAQVQAPKTSLIHVDISGFRNDKGQVFCSLYSSPDGFPKDTKKAVVHVTSAISQEHAVCEFSGIPPGTYAVSVFHDENFNGKLDTNFMGIPREGVGASNNAKGHLGPPKFHDASFHFSVSRLDLQITITYL